MVDEKTKIGNFFNKDEIILYKNIKDLSSKIIKFSNDNKLRCKIAKKGRDNSLINQETAKLMMMNHLPYNKHINELSKYPLKGKQYYKGDGLGLGGSICIDEIVGLSNSREGDFGWGGAASTAFYISDKFDYSLVFLTQVLESEETRKLNSEIKKLVNGCVDVHKK